MIYMAEHKPQLGPLIQSGLIKYQIEKCVFHSARSRLLLDLREIVLTQVQSWSKVSTCKYHASLQFQ